ncbi:hypothetical protein DITRI_Ditri05aG0086400 [Diplodiscus trichospermus]
MYVGRSTLFTGDVASNQKGVNDPEFGAYWYGDNSSKESKSEDAPTNKGVNDPEFGAYWYGDNSDKESKGKESKSEDTPTNEGVNDPEFGAYWYGDNSDKQSKSEAASTNKGINDPEFGAYWYGDNSDKQSKTEDAPTNKGINDPEFGAYWYGDNSDKQSKTEDAPTNKGVNDPEFGAYWYGDNSDKESKTKDASTNKGVNDPNFGNRKSLGRKSNHDNDTIKQTMYFFEKDLLHGTKVNLPRLVQKKDSAIFLPQQVSESLMPMSNDKLPEILKNFSLKAESRGANDVKITVKNCERAEMKGEEKYCATSFESFVDLGVSMLGKNIQLLSHEFGKETKNPLFTIGRGLRNMGENDIVCHKMKYPYAVYLCHSIKKTEVYKVPLLGIDGTKAKALAVCHKDTSAWSPNHIAFRLLKVKPGVVPICHFLGRDTLIWVAN